MLRINRETLLLLAFPILSVLISLWVEANFLVSTLLFFGLPAVWLSYKTPGQIARVSLFTLALTIPLILFIDYLGTVNNAWLVPDTVFPWRILGLLPIEDVIWGFLLIYTTVLFYEHFFGKQNQVIVHKKMKYWVGIWVVILTPFFIILANKPQLLQLAYTYLWIGVIFGVIPITTFLWHYPKFCKNFALTTAYFFFVALLFEITGVHLGQWIFPASGQFIGWVQIFNIRFPIEEFLFWLLLSTATFLTYYEFFNND